MPLSEMSIIVSLKREFFSFCGNVTQYTVKNSHFCCLKELGHAVSLFNCSLMLPNEKQIGQRYMLLLLTPLEMQVGNFSLGHRMKFIPHISVVHNLFGEQ